MSKKNKVMNPFDEIIIRELLCMVRYTIEATGVLRMQGLQVEESEITSEMHRKKLDLAHDAQTQSWKQYIKTKRHCSSSSPTQATIQEQDLQMES